MKRIIVILWPEGKAGLIEHRATGTRLISSFEDETDSPEPPAANRSEFGSTEPEGEKAGTLEEASEAPKRESGLSAEKRFPADWFAPVPAVRILFTGKTFYRETFIPPVEPEELLSTVLSELETTLPFHVEETAICFPSERPRRNREVLAAVTGRKFLTAAEAWYYARVPDGITPPKPEWIGPVPAVMTKPDDGGYDYDSWSGFASGGRWRLCQCGPDREMRHEVLLSALDKSPPLAWKKYEAIELFSRAGGSAPRGAWVAKPRRRAFFFRHFTSFLAAITILLLLAGGGLRLRTIRADEKLLHAEMEKAFHRALPAKRMVAPEEQLRRALKGIRSERDSLLTRLEKRGSALNAWSLLADAAEGLDLTFDDAGIGEHTIKVSGRCAGIAEAQQFATRLRERAGKYLPGEELVVSDPDVQRSGDRFDFSIEARRK
ncbi:MAG: hypothetical protein D6679_04670 [Candidatus Hydrogenedentota bacterium]|nr:MAG: hypothetical protein D6679_04670 [Candidatus Hydrogenedentota bacterium]